MSEHHGDEDEIAADHRERRNALRQAKEDREEISDEVNFRVRNIDKLSDCMHAGSRSYHPLRATTYK